MYKILQQITIELLIIQSVCDYQFQYLKTMGNQLIKGYSIQGEPQSNIGNFKCWKLYRGKKEGSNLPVSIFLIQKKQLKKDKEQILKYAKKQAINLAKIRHPGVLALVQPLIEDQNIVAFVAQRVQGNISSLIRTGKLSEFINSQLQLKMNLLPLLQTICFLHQNVRLCHLGINFDNIFVTADGKWKLSGMSYSQTLSNQQYSQNQTIFMDYMHCSPELVNQNQFNDKADSFSIGILLINFLKALKKQFKVQITAKDRTQYERNMTNFKNLAQTQILTKSQRPQQLFRVLAQLLNPNSENRIKISQISASQWVNDKTVLTVKYLQKICNFQVKQQLQFLKGLAGVIQDFDNRILTKRILPILMDMLKFNQLIASIIFITIDIIKKNLISVQNFKNVVWPPIKIVTQGKQMTAQSLFLLVSNMTILQKFMGETQFFNCIVPLYLKCFDCPPKLKILALRGVQKFSKKYDYQFTKSKLIPKLVNVMKDQNMDIRKNALRALYAIIAGIDAQTITTVILTGLQNSRKAGADNFVNSITVQIYNKMMKNLSSQVLGTKIIPALLPYLTDPTIKQSQFGLYKNTLFKMIQKVQAQRKKTWADQSGQIVQKYNQKDFIFGKQQDIQKKVTQKANYSFLNEYTEQKKQQLPKTQVIQQQQPIRTQIISPNEDLNFPKVDSSHRRTQITNIKTNPLTNNGGFSFQLPSNQHKIDFDFQSSFKPANIQQKKTEIKVQEYNLSSSSYNPPDDQFDFDQTQVKYQPLDQKKIGKPLQNKELPFSPQTTFKLQQSSKQFEKPVVQKLKPKEKRVQEPQIKPLIKNQPQAFSTIPDNTLGQKKLSEAKLDSPKKLVGPKIKKPNNTNPYSLDFQKQSNNEPVNNFAATTKPQVKPANIAQFNFPVQIKNTNSSTLDFNWLQNTNNNSSKPIQQTNWSLPKTNKVQAPKVQPISGMNFGFQSKVEDDDPFAQIDREYGMDISTNSNNVEANVVNLGNQNNLPKNSINFGSQFNDLI